MRILRALGSAAGCLVALSTVGRAQEHEGHEHHGEQVGRVEFPSSCRPAAAERLERAVAYLHNFWYEKAGEASQAVVVADSACALGYWGQAMSLFHPLWTPPRSEELATGLALIETGLGWARTTRERDYLVALSGYYRGYETADHKIRMAAYADSMAALVRRHPRDREAAIFYSVALLGVAQSNAEDTTLVWQRRADSILEPLFRANPGHPGLAHYIIHANDTPALARNGLRAARRYARIAPDVPHAHHMPSHIFTRLGLWEESIASNARSAAAGERFEKAQGLDALWDQRGHALDYMVYAYLQEGRDREAARVVGDVENVTRVYPSNSLISDYALAAIPARYALERGDWAAATRLSVRPAPAWRATEAITYFAHALGAARTGDTAQARNAIAELAAIEESQVAQGGVYISWATQVRIQRLAAEAWLAWATADTAGAVRVATEAADLEDHTEKHPVTPGAVLPARELLGDLFWELGRPAEALRAYQQSLARSPNRPRSLFGLIRSAERAGDKAATREARRQFEELMRRSDGLRAEFVVGH